MKKHLLLLIIAMVILAGGVVGLVMADAGAATDQGVMDDYVTMVKSLQYGDSTARDSVLNRLSSSRQWTLMDEVGDYTVDEIDEYMTLGLNAMAYKAASSRLEDYGTPKGVFVDGGNTEFDVCFIEKCLAPGSEVSYELERREGAERLAVVEMNEGDIDVTFNGGRLEPREDLSFRTEFNGSGSTLRVRNLRAYYVSFVIINEH